MFQWLNFSFLLGSLAFAKAIIETRHLERPLSFLFLVFVFLNFNVGKELAFNPVMTDNATLFLSLGIVFFHGSRRFVWLGIFLLMSMFTMPIVALFYPIYFLLGELKPNINTRAALIIDRYFKIVPVAVSACFIAISAAIVYYLKRTTVYTFPDEINVAFFPLVLAVNTVFIYVFVLRFKPFFLQLFFCLQSVKSWISNRWTWAIVAVFVLQFLVAKINNYHLLGYSGLLVGYPIILNLKPLIGLVDNLNFYGPVVFLFLIYFFRSGSRLEIPVQEWFLLFLFFIIIIKPEARHTLFLIPPIALFLLRFLSGYILSRRFVGSVLACGFLFAKTWYPAHWAIFPPAHLLFTPQTDPAIFQQFPIQHYFMHQGPMISWPAYGALILIEAVCFWWLLYEFRQLKPRNTWVAA